MFPPPPPPPPQKAERLQLLCKISELLSTFTPPPRQAGRGGGTGGEVRGERGGFLCNISLIYCLLGYIRIYIETNLKKKKKGKKNEKICININPACWTCTVIISILYFHLLVYIKSMLLICASPWFPFFFFLLEGGCWVGG